MIHNMEFLGALYKGNGEIDEKIYDDLKIDGHYGDAECAKENGNL